VGTSLRAVDLIEVFERKLELRRECLDASPKLASGRGESLLKRGWMTVGYSITIESWKVILEDGLNKQHMDDCVGNAHKYHDPGHKAVTSPLKDVEEERDKGRAQNNAESPALTMSIK